MKRLESLWWFLLDFIDVLLQNWPLVLINMVVSVSLSVAIVLLIHLRIH